MVIATHHLEAPPTGVGEHVEQLEAPPDALAELASEIELQRIGVSGSRGVVNIDDDDLSLSSPDKEVRRMEKAVRKRQEHRLRDGVDDVEKVVKQHHRGELAHRFMAHHGLRSSAPVVALRSALPIPFHKRASRVNRHNLFNG